MAAWISTNWFQLLQTASLAGGLFFACVTLRHDLRVRRTEVAISLSGAHRDIWSRLIDRPGLSRVLDPAADAVARPPTAAEHRFVLLVILHIDTVRQAVLEGAFDPSPGLDEDIRGFLRLPIPGEVAKSVARFQTAEFREFLLERLDGC